MANAKDERVTELARRLIALTRALDHTTVVPMVQKLSGKAGRNLSRIERAIVTLREEVTG